MTLHDGQLLGKTFNYPLENHLRVDELACIVFMDVQGGLNILDVGLVFLLAFVLRYWNSPIKDVCSFNDCVIFQWCMSLDR
jgi:hypothetical protein